MECYLDLIGQKFPSTNQKQYPDLGNDQSSVQNFCTVLFLTHFLGLYLVQFSSQHKSYGVYIVSGFIPLFEQIIQGLFKDFQSHISHFSGFSNSVQKRALSLCLLQFFHNRSNFIPRVSLCCSFSLEFYLNYKVSIEIQGLSSTDCNFQGLSRT